MERLRGTDVKPSTLHPYYREASLQSEIGIGWRDHLLESADIGCIGKREELQHQRPDIRGA